MGYVGAFIGIAIMLGIGVQILGNSVQDCTTLQDYREPRFVESVTIKAGGSGYTSNPTVTFSGGGATEQATGTAVRTGTTITGVTVIDGGSGYETLPTIAFTGGGGSNAQANATLTDQQTGWAGQCETNNTQTQNAYTLLVIILIVVAAVAILTVVRML